MSRQMKVKLLCVLIVVSPSLVAHSTEVQVLVGPTPIPGGTAQGARDITLANSHMAVSFAVDTAPPWGVPRGGIIDVAVVSDGLISPDRASLVDFMPNGWSKWIDAMPVTSVLERGPDEAVVQTRRSWMGVSISTTFSLKSGQSLLHMVTQMSNPGTNSHAGLKPGYSLWPDGGFLFGIPGLQGQTEGSTEAALANWSAAYDSDWVMGLHVPFAGQMAYESRDRFRVMNLQAGETLSFEAWLQIDGSGSLAPLVLGAIELEQLPYGRVHGKVLGSDGLPMAAPAVVVQKIVSGKAQAYSWVVGQNGAYEMILPPGSYSLYATGKGYSNSTPRSLELSAGKDVQLDFTDAGPPAILNVHVLDADSGRPTDARLTMVQGDAPLIRYFGDGVFFTELEPAGWVRLGLAPGAYTFALDAGAGFTSNPVKLDVDLQPGELQDATVKIPVLADPAAQGWYSGDLHHHSDVLDGFTEPAYVMRSELAAGLNVTMLSDHDSVVNNLKMQQLAASRGIPFIAGTELSPSWAHFNAYPLEEGAQISIDPGSSTVQAIFAEARRMGADVIQVNHPYISYGYFHTDEAGEVPGGYSDAFDLVEITAADLATNLPSIERTWSMWNAGQAAWFSAGSDVHDVWQAVSGAARMYVKVDGELSIESFIAALKNGHSYASTGPLVYPEIIFGTNITADAGEPLELNYTLHAVNGLKSVTLVEQGVRIQVFEFDGTTAATPLSLTVMPGTATWYSLLAEDIGGKFLVSNPVIVGISNAGVSGSDSP